MMHEALDIKQTKDANDMFKGIKQESIKEIKDIKEVIASAAIKPDLKEDTPKILSEVKPKEKKKELSREINIDETLKDDIDKKVRITFKGKNFMKDEISKKTADAPLVNEDEPIKLNQPKVLGQVDPIVDEIKREIEKVEEDTKSNFTPDDYDAIAEFIIDTLDWGGSSALMYIAKDNTDAPYTLATDKKNRLRKQLSRILLKSNAKMNFGVLFAISLVLAYMKPIKSALETRKQIKFAEETFKRKKAKEAKEKIEKQREDALKEKNKIKVADKVKRDKVTIKDEEIKTPPKRESINIKEEVLDVINEDVIKKKPTEDTKLDEKTGKVTLDRPRGNPRTRRRNRDKYNE